MISFLSAAFVMTKTAPAALVVWALLRAGKTVLIASTTENRTSDFFNIEKLLESTKFERAPTIGNPTHQVASLRLGKRTDQSFALKKSFNVLPICSSPLVDISYRLRDMRFQCQR
jgi:hypothetical protein